MYLITEILLNPMFKYYSRTVEKLLSGSEFMTIFAYSQIKNPPFRSKQFLIKLCLSVILMSVTRIAEWD